MGNLLHKGQNDINVLLQVNQSQTALQQDFSWTQPEGNEIAQQQKNNKSTFNVLTEEKVSDTQEKYYDVVLPCSLMELCDYDRSETKETGATHYCPRVARQGYWKLQINREPSNNEAIGHWNGRVVGIMGNYNTGKTWILGRLSDYEFPANGMTVRTEGICCKWIQTQPKTGSKEDSEIRYHLAIDTAGFNSPIALAKAENPTVRREKRIAETHEQDRKCVQENTIAGFLDRAIDRSATTSETNHMVAEETISDVAVEMQEIHNSEHFVASMTLALSNYIIVVMQETSVGDQKFLFDVQRKWFECYSREKSSRYEKVFVIHNFRTTDNVEEMEELFSVKTGYKRQIGTVIVFLLLKQSTCDVYEGLKSVEGGVPVFECRRIKSTHVCLMNDKSAAGKSYNSTVFDLIKDWIHNTLSPLAEPLTAEVLKKRFADSATQLLNRRRYLQNIAGIDLKREANETLYVPRKINKDKKITSMASNTKELYSHITFRPEFLISSYKSRAKTDCLLVQMEVPGMTEQDIEVRLDSDESKPGCFAIEVSGSKARKDFVTALGQVTELQGNERLLPTIDPNPKSMETSEDTCRYGDFRQLVQIDMKFKRTPVKVGPIDGILYLLFEKEETEEQTSEMHECLSSEV
jgi:GTPase SAR1 family protein